jgi:site-specific DNA-methyltransferase (adenine-specific)
VPRFWKILHPNAIIGYTEAVDGRIRAPRNRTLTLNENQEAACLKRCLRVEAPVSPESITDRTILGDFEDVAPYLPRSFVDLAFLDPPYNLDKTFHTSSFRKKPNREYGELFERWLLLLLPLLKPTASLYVCADWHSSGEIQSILSSHLILRNRIVWEREKGRGAKKNWKNSSEDIWFATVSPEYHFDVEAVKLKRRILAPYTDKSGRPKGWEETEKGRFRLTYPSNLWTDLTVPYWSMRENTDHPTQKPEKLLAKIILASSRAGDLVFDPFLGAGTSSVTAKKLGRRYCGIEREAPYAALAERRLAMAEEDPSIQGYTDGVFWERNSKK